MTIHDVITLESDVPVSIHVDDSGAFMAAGGTGLSLRPGAAIAFPGLINSHDHLDFNTFPQLGNSGYPNYVSWGNEIHQTHDAVIRTVLNVPVALRVQWSLYKNLLNGVTTVVQHGPQFETGAGPIDVFSDCVAIHSLRLERKWKLRLNKPRIRPLPVVVHIGEGTDDAARAEVSELVRWNLLRRKLIGVHGIAMSPEQARAFHALVWCPESNHFLYGATADIRALEPVVPVVFGTDSTLSAGWSLWQQLRSAASRDGAPPAALYEMLTSRPAAVWALPQKGSLVPGTQADLVIARRKADRFLDAFMAVSPEDILLVLSRGKVRLIDADAMEMAVPFLGAGFTPIRVGNTIKHLSGDLAELMRRIREYYPDFDIVNPVIAPLP